MTLKIDCFDVDIRFGEIGQYPFQCARIEVLRRGGPSYRQRHASRAVERTMIRRLDLQQLDQSPVDCLGGVDAPGLQNEAFLACLGERHSTFPELTAHVFERPSEPDVVTIMVVSPSGLKDGVVSGVIPAHEIASGPEVDRVHRRTEQGFPRRPEVPRRPSPLVSPMIDPVGPRIRLRVDSGVTEIRIPRQVEVPVEIEALGARGSIALCRQDARGTQNRKMAGQIGQHLS